MCIKILSQGNFCRFRQFFLLKMLRNGAPNKKPALEKTRMLSVSKTGSFLMWEFNRTSASHF